MRSVIVAVAICVMHTAAFGQNPEPIPCVNGVCTVPQGAAVHVGKSSRWYTVQSSPGFAYCTSPEPMAYQPRQRRFALFNRNRRQYEAFRVEPLPIEIPQVAIDAADTIGALPQKETLPEPEPKIGSQPRIINDPEFLTGVDASRLSQTPTYDKNGVRRSRDDIIEAMAANIVDLSNKRRITIIGKDSDMRNALNALPPDVDNWAVVKTYPPDNWYVKSSGFQTQGTPVVYIQEPDGTVIHRQDDADNLAEAVKAAKDYNPAKDSDLRKLPFNLGGNMFSFSFGGVLWFAVGCIAGAVAWPTVKAMWNTLNAARIAEQKAAAERAAAAEKRAEDAAKAQAEVNRQMLETLAGLKGGTTNRKQVLDS
jgi:hypothetical protein